ncbi:hypothetical protein BT96DRAFT_983813 [Gymnopus androsaceus JB14]|uniref:Fungal-type protein kinase domain-containing protein n=1 Tax=Gymnopus androsaceus JB14 TaxID=1447944 RepID=A0A6A4II13_9AGAR|nr:hypothetical protein BT96DRAFT_983813 [Gymnopus androsaceus JB14]
MDSSQFTFHYRNEERTFIIKRVLFQSDGMVGQGRFPSATQEAEDKIILDARKLAESSDKKWKWVLNHLPVILHSFDTILNSARGCHKNHPNGEYKKRVMRVTVQEKLHPIAELEGPMELAQVFYDIVQVHEWLYEHARVLHGEISEVNLMFRRIDGKIYGVLNDFDLSFSVDRLKNGPSSDHRSWRLIYSTRSGMAKQAEHDDDSDDDDDSSDSELDSERPFDWKP